LLKKAHLRRWLTRAALRRTRKYASHVASLAALHLALFEQPEEIEFLSNPLSRCQNNLNGEMSGTAEGVVTKFQNMDKLFRNGS
jgi:hypothetical protein